jgi:hypothetical protein
MEEDNTYLNWLSISELPVFLKGQLEGKYDPGDYQPREKLHRRLQSLISKFVSEMPLELQEEDISSAFDDIPSWTVENVLAKLRSLTEIKAKKQIRVFCSGLSDSKRQSTQALLNNAGMHKFRESTEMDMYVGIHTAISAYFKMAGVAISQKNQTSHTYDLKSSCELLFKALKIVASQPLGCLMALDGLFWDSKLYSIPKHIVALKHNNALTYMIDKAELQRRFMNLKITEYRHGCPALKARTAAGENSMDLIASLCLKTITDFSKLDF